MKPDPCKLIGDCMSFLKSFTVEVDWVAWGERTTKLDFPHPVHDLATRMLTDPQPFSDDGTNVVVLRIEDAEAAMRNYFVSVPEFEFPATTDGTLHCADQSYPIDLVYLIWRACLGSVGSTDPAARNS